jgi:hypothetical protein
MEAISGHPWWLLLLAAIGLFSIVVMGMTLFSAIGERPGTSSVTHDVDVRSPEFLLGLAGIVDSPFVTGGARLLNNGDEFLPAMLEAFRRGGALHQLHGLRLGRRDMSDLDLRRR